MTNNYIPTKKINRLFMLIIALCFGYGVNAQEQKFGNLNFNKAVNISGKQRMLSQRMAKTYLYLITNPQDAKAKRSLLTTGIIFEKQNKILSDNSESINTKKTIEKVNELWSLFKGYNKTVPNYPNAEKVITLSKEMLDLTNQVVNSIINESQQKNQNSSIYADESLNEESLELKKIINVSGKQRMLSQRLGLYYFANSSKLKSKENANALRATFNSLDAAITDLLISNFNTPAIDEKLGIAMSRWETVKNEQQKLINHSFTDIEIYKLSNDLTKAFNDVTILYEKIKL